MKRFWTKMSVLLVATLAILLPGSPALASARGIKDNANFFTADGEQKANAVIDDIFKKHSKKEVLIEAFPDVPPGSTYPQFVQQRFREARVDGVYIMIVSKGAHVSVRADSVTNKLFTDDVCAKLAQRLAENMKAAGKPPFDAPLLDAVQSIADTFTRSENQGAAVQRSSPGSYTPPVVTNSGSRSSGGMGGGFLSHIWGWVCLGIGVWIVIALVRSVIAHRSGGFGGGGYGGGGPGYGGGGPGYGGYGGGYGGGGGGGGFGSSLLGGLFGAAAGSWLYDRFSHGGGSAYGAPPADSGYGGGGYAGGGAAPSTPDWAGPGDSGTGGGSGGDASFGGGGDAGGGGDFGGGGDAGGGGDFGGGGDAGGGGGDAGGGDFGGGGDAGGGGDFA